MLINTFSSKRKGPLFSLSKDEWPESENEERDNTFGTPNGLLAPSPDLKNKGKQLITSLIEKHDLRETSSKNADKSQSGSTNGFDSWEKKK